MSGHWKQDKTEQPTRKKLSDARNKGNVAQSKEISTVMILFSSLGVLFFAGSWMLDRLVKTMRGMYQRAGTMQMVPENMNDLFWEIFFASILVIIPLMMAVLIAGVIGNVAQFGFLITGEKLKFDLAKLDPIKGFKKFVSLKSLVELVKSIIKLVIIGGVAYVVLQHYLDQIPGLMQLSVSQILSFAGHVSFQVCFYICLVLVVLAISDFAYARWQYKKDLRMTKQEVKDEFKNREGDPKVKARIRSTQREMAISRVHRSEDKGDRGTKQSPPRGEETAG